MEKQILALLPPDLAPHCRLGGLGEGRLRLTTTNPAWAARLRFQSARLLQQLKRQGVPSIRSVQVRIIPPALQRPAPVSRVKLSQTNARLLEQTASAVQDPGLAAALRRLARRAQSRG